MTDSAAAQGADDAARRSGIWWLLSRLVTEPPAGPWLDELEAALGSVDAGEAAPLGPESAALLAALRAAREEPDGLTALAVDRTRLLSGVTQKKQLPAPYETAALGLEMNSDRMLQVVEAYRTAGFDEPAPELGPPDYLGTELRFMALLCYREMEAHRAQDPGLVALWLERQQQFLDQHLLTWAPQHCTRLAAQAATPFYAALAALVGRACLTAREDIATLAAIIPGLVPASDRESPVPAP